MGAKLGGSLFALFFAVPFGGVGAFASYGIWDMVKRSYRAGDWVVVQAKVEQAALTSSRSKNSTTYKAEGRYRYRFGNRDYQGDQLGFMILGGSDNVGSWQEEMASHLIDARDSGRTIPVYVNPDDPAEAVVDRGIRWGMLLFMGVFAVLFGAVGLGAFVAMVAVWFGGGKAARKRKGSMEAYVANRNRAAMSDAGAKPDADETPPTGNPERIAGAQQSGAKAFWVFAILWNLLTWPIAAIVLYQAMERGEWLSLIVLLFPLVGVLLLALVIRHSLGMLRRGKSSLSLEPRDPHMGGKMAGAVTFAKPGALGELFEVMLVALDRGATKDNATPLPRWSTTRKVPLASDPRGGSRLPFQFEIPARIDRVGTATEWQVSVRPSGDTVSLEEFPVHVGPAKTTQSLFEPVPQ
ncbi:hypothetical protein DSM104443_00763 [Usitatibacter rugosus]|uniref:DUF3592 domain-containing protein n=1 Tax=Usitatibacter rugosus TaxID=2732067 RepID=A0A6M4GTS1_9PROT|nr:DUF3592 domain-containing protein [Usitatibacter rugosus]QJR09713.1 hypothetical protein DSM104443_00763 [Usitatibacter rugosus]